MDASRKCRRFSAAVEDSGDLVECTGESCRSCSAIAVADCVALCCCPCAVVSLLFLTFLKAPWVVGRRCFRLLTRTKRRRICLEERKESYMVQEWEDAEPRLKIDDGSDCGGGGGDGNLCTGFEAEKIWLELYQAGQLGFGRVSIKG